MSEICGGGQGAARDMRGEGGREGGLEIRGGWLKRNGHGVGVTVQRG